MLSKNIFLKKIHFKTAIIFFIFFYNSLTSGASDGEVCLKKNTNFFSRYFSGQSRSNETVEYFQCLNDMLTVFLTYTEGQSPNYYTRTEIRRLMQYLGAKKPQAEKMSKAFFQIKVSFIGGDENHLFITEITVFRTLLRYIKERMLAIQPIMPDLVALLNKKNIPRKRLMHITQVLKDNLNEFGHQLSNLSIKSNLSKLVFLPEHLKTLGFSNQNLRYWQPLILILDQWNEMFLSPPKKHIIQNKDWSFVLSSFADVSALWLYHKRFLEGRDWLHGSVIQHTQHFLSYALHGITQTLHRSKHHYIALKDIDELTQRMWFLPALSTSTFRLALRSTFCFLLNPLTNNKTCSHEITTQDQDITLSFSDLSFTLGSKSYILREEHLLHKSSDRINKKHLTILRQYLNSWIKSENDIRKTYLLPDSLFGSPHLLLNRRLSSIDGKRLIFYKDQTNIAPFYSHLNWQSHITQLITSAYTQRGEDKVDQNLWNTMIKEWTILNATLYKSINWRGFLNIGFQIFKHGDLLLSSSNGDRLLQEQEILELFSMFISTLSTTISALDITQTCIIPNKLYKLNAGCFWRHMEYLPSAVFIGFPKLLSELSVVENANHEYISKFKNFYDTSEISFKNVFDTFLFIHYQENTMEYLDRDFSNFIDTQELEHLLTVFENIIIEDIPLIYTKKTAFAFITYIFYHGELPIFGPENQISSPVRFSNWLLQPNKWNISARRQDILQTLLIMNKNL